jgi:DNA-binding MarR family transcriptional regulator
MLAGKQIDGVEVITQDLAAPSRGPGPGGEQELSAARLRIAVARLSRRLRPTAAAGRLTATEVDLLVAAERRGPMRLSDLASFAGLNPTMVSRIIPKLEEAGLVRRLPDEVDRRVCRVEATGKGRRLLERVRSERNDALSCRLMELEPSAREAVLAALPVLEELAERVGQNQPSTSSGVGR